MDRKWLMALLIGIIAINLSIGCVSAATCTQNIDSKTHSKVLGTDKLVIKDNTIKLKHKFLNKHGFNYHIDKVVCYYKNGDVVTYNYDVKRWNIVLHKNVVKVVVHYSKMNDTEINLVSSSKLIPKKISVKAKPSCGCHNSYKWHSKTFFNYCPNCHRFNCLLKNPKGVYEKELTCKYCDSDFCGVCGKEKYSWSRTYLIKG